MFGLRKTPSRNLPHDSISLKSHAISTRKAYNKAAKFVHITLQKQQLHRFD